MEKTKLVYPVCVFFSEGNFFSHVPSVGEAEKFAEDYIISNNLPKETTEVYFYDRKAWIALLLDVKKEKLKFVIEKERICTFKSVDAIEEVEVEIDWMKEDNLELYYTVEEIEEIEENRIALQDISFITKEIMDSLPHIVISKSRIAEITVKKDVLVTELAGEKYEFAQ